MVLGWLIRLFVVLVLVRLGWRFFSGALQARPQQRNASSHAGVRLVRDPVCGTFVDRSKALSVEGGQVMHYFCSEECRALFQKERYAGTGRA